MTAGRSLEPERVTVNPIKLEIGLRPNSAGIPYTLLLRIEAMGFPTFGLLLHTMSQNPDPLSPELLLMVKILHYP